MTLGSPAPSPASSSRDYAGEIDGLRAVAVLLVVLFHLGIDGVGGGFIGVDVFFVISGYLITGLIVAALDDGRFSFGSFYARRAARILPALLATILAVLLLGAFLQLPGAFAVTAKQSLYALFSVSNFYFWSTISYWAAPAKTYVLLHTWSLGVEEQFYLVYPLLLVLSYRRWGRTGAAVVLGLLFVASCVASELTVRTSPMTAFYFTPLRFHEFALGGLGALYPAVAQRLRARPLLAAAVTASGIGLIVWGAANFTAFSPLPGVLVLSVTGGALAVILAGASPVARPLLANPVMRWLGRISYSLYLVHWPIILFYRYRFGSELSTLEQLALGAVMLVVADQLYRQVEQRFRFVGGRDSTAAGASTRNVLGRILAGSAGLALAAAVIVSNEGWASRLPAEAQELMNISPPADMIRRRRFFDKHCQPAGEDFCGQAQTAGRNIWLAGDSRVLDLYIALREAYPEENILASYAMGCAPVFSEEASVSIFFAGCGDLNRRRMQHLLTVPDQDVIFLGAHLPPSRATYLLDTVRQLRAAGKTVYLFGEFRITGERNPVELAIEISRSPDDETLTRRFLMDEPYSLDGEYASEIAATGAHYISYRPLFFRDGGYHFTDPDSGKLLTYDGIHLNRYGASRFGAYLRKNYPMHP